MWIDGNMQIWVGLWVVDTKMSPTQECLIGLWYVNILYMLACGSASFSKQYNNVTNNILLYLTNYYIFVCTVILLIVTIRFTLFQCQYLLKYDIYTNCHLLQNQLRSHGPVFSAEIARSVRVIECNMWYNFPVPLGRPNETRLPLRMRHSLFLDEASLTHVWWRYADPLWRCADLTEVVWNHPE